jgi:HAD superfamily hydrolase (TIGR01509 family)
VDGRPRGDGTRAFLASRNIVLAEGDPNDPPGTPTVHGLSNHKNELFLRLLARDGVGVYDGSVRYVRAARAAGLRCAVVSSSVNTVEVLRAAGMAELFDTLVDGGAVISRHLAGKPAPDTFLAAAEALQVAPAAAAVFEDAVAGVEAGRAGRFRCVIGVDRDGYGDALRMHGADIVVSDLADLLAP